MPEFRSATLPSGLRIAAEIDTRSYSAAFGYFVRAGSRDEVDCESGLSHYLEHMMFKGTAQRSAADVNRELDELGGQSNAFTTEEQTVYYSTVLPKFQDRLLDLLSDMLDPHLDANEFETERQVILEEIAKYEDQPPFGAFERMMEVYFGPRGLGRRVLGTSESIQSMTVDRMRAYFNRRYRPENIVLAASGNVDFDAMVQMVSDRTESWSSRPKSDAPPADDSASLPPGIQMDRTLPIADAFQAYCVSMAEGPTMKSDDRYAVRVLASVIGDEGGSRLFWDLIDTGRAEVATVWPHEFTDSGAWFSYMVCAPEDVTSNQRLIDDVLQSVVDKGVQPAELEQAVNKATAGCIMQSERPGNRLFGLGSRWLMCDDYVSIDETLGRLRELNVESVSRAAAKYLTAPTEKVLAIGEEAEVSGS